MFTAAFRRDVGDGSLENFEQSLLDAFAGNITGNRGIALGAGNLVELVDVDDTEFGETLVIVGGLIEADEDVFDILTDIAGLGQHGGIGDGKGHLQEFGQGAGDEGFSGSGGTDQEDI